jgi:NIPSNAP
MILEIRSYALKVGAVPQALGRFTERLPGRTKVSPIAGFFQSEIGMLNQIHMMWPYADLAERERLRAVKVENYPPPMSDIGVELDVRIWNAAPFSPKIEPRQYGGLYEIRTYTYAAGSIPHVIEGWSGRIAERQKYSPLVFAGFSEFGIQNLWIHIWAYKDFADRQRVREEVHAKGVWPPKSAPEAVPLRQQNVLVVPTALSPWH